MATTEQIRSVESRARRHKNRKWDRMFVQRSLLESAAFAGLKTPAAYQVLFRFLGKCQWKQARRPCTREKSWIVVNNGEIEFSYREANRLGISSKQFTRAIDELLRVGFLDIERSGYGLKKDRTLFAISDRWLAFGTDEFEVQVRQKRTQKIGFQKGNTHGRNNVARKKTTSL